MNNLYQNPNANIVIGKISPIVIIVGLVIIVLLLGGFSLFCKNITTTKYNIDKYCMQSNYNGTETPDSTLLNIIIKDLSSSLKK